MPASSPLKSMFLRRLVMLLAVVAAGLVVLTGQLWRLTVAQGASLREDAESKLLTREWIPTMRGRVLDRKGRVLAQDRPSFDIAVDYRVIGGEWAVRQAAAVAKAEAGAAAWRKLDPQERQERIDLYVPVFLKHLEAMWARMAQVGGVSEGKLLETRVAIEQRISAMTANIMRRRIGRELEARMAAGQEITPEVEEEFRKRLITPLSEQKAPHVVLPSVPDPVGFELRRLAEQRVDLTVPLMDGARKIVEVPLMPGLTVIDSGDREYPFERIEVDADLSTLPGPVRREGAIRVVCEGVAYHVLGRMKETAQAEDSERRRRRAKEDAAFAERIMTPHGVGLPRPIDRGQYVDNDPAGLSGVEASQEDELRGLRGLRVQRLDTGREEVIEPESGRDVHLTLDVMLQARVQAAMSREVGLAVAQPWQRSADHGENATVPDGTLLSGAAVVLEVDSGDILAMVSTPTISRERLRLEPDAIFRNALNEKVDVPWVDRSIARPYPPGSIVKALMVTAGVKAGKLSLDVPIECDGHLFPNRPEQFRCWIYKQFGRTHGPLLAPDALMVSCNIYFFTLGQRLGADGVVAAYRAFGVGETWGLGVGTEFAGSIGSYMRGEDGALARDAQGRPATAAPSLSDATQMGIGQGPVTWTPLHAADAYATLARGGVRMKPRLIDAGAMPQTQDLGLDPRAVRQALEGLAKSVNEHSGTGHHIRLADGTDEPHFNAAGVQVWGKTGTAEAPPITVRAGEPLFADGVDDPALPVGVRALRKGDHSWFVVLAGRRGEDRPRYAIAVMMEYAGSGGRVSGPLVNQVIHALVKEGYL